MVDERFMEQYDMSHFILLMINKVPLGSIWAITDYLDDLYSDFKDFVEIKRFTDGRIDCGNSQIRIIISENFIIWFEMFILNNYRFSDYLGTHSLSFERKVFFFQVESQNLCFDKVWTTTQIGLDKIPKQDYPISLADSIDIDEIW
jgi:hypothetical protein